MLPAVEEEELAAAVDGPGCGTPTGVLFMTFGVTGSVVVALIDADDKVEVEIKVLEAAAVTEGEDILT